MQKHGMNRVICVALTFVMIFSSPAACFAEQLDVGDENVIIEETENSTDDFLSNDIFLSEEEIQKKQGLAADVDRLVTMSEGDDYEAGTVYRVTDSEDMALFIAEKYDAELSGYENGIAIYRLPETLSVYEAVQLGADVENDYPAVYPDYISNSADVIEVVEVPENESIEDDSVEQDLVSDSVDIDSYIADYAGIDEPYLNEKEAYYQWHHAAIGSTYSLASEITGTGVKVALISSGINSHDDIDTSRIVDQKSYVSGSENYYGDTDPSGIGTFLAGLLVAQRNGSLGVGICPDADIMNVRVSSSNVTSLLKGIEYGVYYDADILFVQESYDFPIADVEAAVENAYSRGIAVFAPVAFTGDSFEVWPAAYPHVISVAGVDKNGMRFGGTSISKNVDFAAPAAFIYSCSSAASNKYKGLNGAVMACGIAVGEAAVILSYKDKLAGFRDRSGNLIPKNSDRVDALKKVMLAGTISTGRNTGKGLVYLPKVLGLSTVSTGPSAPTITISEIKNDGNDYYVDVDVTSDDYDIVNTYSTVNGKNPTYKNGKPSSNSISGGNFKVYLKDINSDTISIKSIVISSSGLSSKVAAKSFSVKSEVCDLKISTDCTNVIPGKTVKFDSIVVPSNTETKRLDWHVSMNGDESAAKAKGITISSKGVLNVGASAPTGEVVVWAVSKIDPSKKSNEITVKIGEQKIKSITPILPELTLYRGASNAISEYELYTYFNYEMIYPNSVLPGNVYFTFSDDKLAEVNSSGYLVAKGPGTVTVTVWAKDGSGVKATMSIKIIQNATEIKGLGDVNDYNKVAVGKTLVMNTPEILPANAAVQKVSSWTVDDTAKANGITVSKGKIKTTTKTSPGTYKVTVSLKNPDDTIITKDYSFEVIPEVVKKISVDKSANIFRMKNHFDSPTTTELKVKIDGGEVFYNAPVKAAFEVKSSNPDILKIDPDNISTSYDGQNGILTIPVAATGGAAGKVKVTIRALDGSGKKATCTVNVLNPASEVKIAPSKDTASVYVTVGKKLPLKAIIGEEYGKVKNKKVTWELTDNTYATITNSGVLIPKTNAPNNESVTVKAVAKDGSGTYAKRTFIIYQNVGKMVITDALGRATKPSGNTYEHDTETLSIFVKVKGKLDSSDPTYFGGFNLGTSNPKVGQIRYTYSYYPCSGTGYYIYEFKGVGISKGKTKLKISTKDGSQSVTYTMTVVP